MQRVDWTGGNVELCQIWGHMSEHRCAPYLDIAIYQAKHALSVLLLKCSAGIDFAKLCMTVMF